MSQKPFIHLRAHTAYSLAEGAITIKALVKTCKQYNMPAVGVTDTANLFGALELALAMSDSGIQPIVGCQLYIESSEGLPDILPVIVQTEQGYRNLLKITSQAYLKSLNQDLPVASWESLERYNQGLIALTGGVTWAAQDTSVGVPYPALTRLLLKHKQPEAEAYLRRLQGIYGDRLYIELTRHGIPSEIALEAKFLELAKHYNIPIVATNHAYFLEADRFPAHDAFLCIAEAKFVNQDNRRRVTEHHRFKSMEEMQKLFQDLPEALENTVNIAKRCSFMPTSHAPILPPFDGGKGLTEQDTLRQMAREGLRVRLDRQVYRDDMTLDQKAEIKDIYYTRLESELNMIIQMGFPGYFLIVADFIQWSKRQRIPVGPGRGSGAGSVVAWSLTITDIDPIRFGLIFERFLNPERVSMPDFDIDFCQERRDEVIHYVQERYGKDKVAQIITFGKLQARAVLRDVGRVLQIPYPVVDRICKLVPNQPNAPITLSEAIEMEPKFQEEAQKEDSVEVLLEYSQQLEGLYRHVSTHAAGVVIGDRPLDELVPLYRDPASDIPVTQFNMKYVELAGLVKFDFLGLKTLTVIQHTVDMLAKRGIEIDMSRVPFDDKPTFDLLTRVETVGVFQLESSGMKDVLRKLKPDTFEDIIALVALYRPGPMDDIPRYIACKHGEQPITYAHPLMEPILKETFGVMVYQEQVMKIAQELGGYSLGGADLLRRAMGKKIKEAMDAERAKFIAGCVKKLIPHAVAEKIFDQMAKFASYGFNKSHSAPYGLLAYHTAFLKANYPIDFFAATMSLDINHTEKLAKFAGEVRRMKVPLLPPDVNYSQVLFDSENGTALRYALSALKGVGIAVMEKVIEERKTNGLYTDIFDFVKRLDSKVVNKRILESMIQGGAFDSLHPNRRQLFENLEYIMSHVGEAKNTQQSSLFTSDEFKPTLAKIEEWPEMEKLNREKAIVGFYLSSHPLDGIELPNITPSSEFEDISDTKEIRIGAVVTAVQKRISKNGNRFAFVQLSDQYGNFEITVFSEALEQYDHLLQEGKTVLVNTLIRVEEEGYSLSALGFKPLESLLIDGRNTLILKVNSKDEVDSINHMLSSVPEGNITITILLRSGEFDVKLTLPKRFHLSIGELKKFKMFTIN
jgi:DNA polymerase-3 subunit alpha